MARHTVKKLDLALRKDGAKNYPEDLAKVVLSEHHTGTLTLVVVNRVARAQEADRKDNRRPSEVVAGL